MKNLFLLTVCITMILSISCQKNEFEPNRETGKLHIGIGLLINVNEVGRGLKSMPRIEDFKVTLYTADGTQVMAFDSVPAMPDTIELETGSYYVEAHSDNDLPAAFENPYYFGASEVFTIGSNTQRSVLVNCELANTIVTILYSGNVTSGFVDYMTTVSSQLGSLLFARDETRMGYFRTLPLEIRVELTYLLPDGSYASKVLSGQIPEPLPNRHYQVFVDAAVNGGMANFSIIMDSSEAVVEVIELTDDSGNPQSGGIGYGELLITEIMYNPSALTDTEGEWFEIYNNSDQTINLQNLVLVRDDLNRHIITESIELSAASYFVFKRTEMATDATNSYVVGSGILLPNTGAVLGIYNEGTETEPGALIFSVNYGGDHFPDSPGASISLNPDMVNPADAILGTSWCIATSVYNTGDFGTPGALNDPCQ